MSQRSSLRAAHDLDALRSRAQRRRSQFTRRVAPLPLHDWRRLATTILARIPGRTWSHLVVVLLVPLAFFGSHQVVTLPPRQAAVLPQRNELDLAGSLLPLAPISLSEAPPLADGPMPDTAFADIVALQEMERGLSDSERTAPPTFLTTVLGDKVNIRTGPGLEYDILGMLAGEAPLVLTATVGEWFAARTTDGQTIWVAAELVAKADRARGILPVATTIPPPPPPKIALVREAELNLRDGPGTAYVALTKLAQGETVDLLGRYDTWFQVQVADQRIGWVTSDFLEIAPGVVERIEQLTTIPDPNPELVAVADGTLNLRGGPGTDYPKLGSVRAGTPLALLARYDDWLKVRTESGETAWVSREVLPVSAYLARRVPQTQNIPARPKPAQVAQSPGRGPAPVPAAQSGSVAAFAAQFVGTPYVWGGSRPGAFDCSGFTKYVYGQFGLSLPHSAAGQYSTRYGAIIAADALVPGDMVFFANTYKRGISHVGVYVGGGMVAQALAPGVPLSIVSMHSAYWQSKYFGALRPFIN
jgi:cell wall-associated NlpC family hydrolase